MNIVLFCHSLLSDWNHGSAHFLRGIVTELAERGHRVDAYEPVDGWSVQNLLAEHGEAPLHEFSRAYPKIQSRRYRLEALDIPATVDGADLVLVHDWNHLALVAALGRERMARPSMRLLFHDTHHRAATNPAEMARYDLSGYDGALTSADSVRERYLRAGWTRRAWTWHEAADTRRFLPLPGVEKRYDVVWIGNWSDWATEPDASRTQELEEFLLGPVRRLGLKALVHGVRFPSEAVAALRAAGVEYGGWLANHRVPEVLATAKVAVHVPRRVFEGLPGVPTIRPFEVLACGVPLVSAPWLDAEELFTSTLDYLQVADGSHMERTLRALLIDPQGPELSRALAEHGRATVSSRHTCAHRVDELLAIVANLSRGPIQRTAASA